MAAITHADLKIASISRTHSKVSVAGRLHFSSSEFERMKNGGLKFRLDCRIFGQDVTDIPPGPDGGLFWMNTKFYPDATPLPDESYEFSGTVPTSVLDEDAGTDEIHARVYLQALGIGLVAGKKSNVVVREF